MPDDRPPRRPRPGGGRRLVRGGRALALLAAGLGAVACLGGQNAGLGVMAAAGEGGGAAGPASPGGDGNVQTQAAPPRTPAAAHATFLGRTLPLDPYEPDHVRMAWSGVAAGVRFRGTTVAATLADANSPAGGGAACALFDVHLDGNRLGEPITVAGGARSYTLVQGLPEGEHTLWLSKRTDADIGVVDFGGFALSGNDSFLTPPVRRGRRLLAVGASTEVGFGVTGTDQGCATAAILYENQNLAWPQLAADLLGADLENLSLAARGLLASAVKVPDANHTTSALFFQTDPFLTGLPWDASAAPVDAVVFNLGANDWHFYGEGPPPKSLFEGTFVALVRRIVAAHPAAHVYLTLVATDTGDERATFAAYLQNIVATLQAQGYGQAHYLAFTPAPGLACWGHPDPALHAQMAREVAVQIAADLGWAPP